MFCKNCGAKISDNARFCPKCGTELKKINSGNASDNKEDDDSSVVENKTILVKYMIVGAVVVLTLIFIVVVIAILSGRWTNTDAENSADNNIVDVENEGIMASNNENTSSNETLDSEESEDVSESTQDSEAALESGTEDAVTEEEVQNEENNQILDESNWKDEYLKQIVGWHDAHQGDQAESYVLFYLNDDDIPELMMTCENSAFIGEDIYTFEEGRAIHIDACLFSKSKTDDSYTFTSKIEDQFVERKGLYFWSWAGNGSQYDQVYIYRNNRLEQIYQQTVSFILVDDGVDQVGENYTFESDLLKKDGESVSDKAERYLDYEAMDESVDYDFSDLKKSNSEKLEKEYGFSSDEVKNVSDNASYSYQEIRTLLAEMDGDNDTPSLESEVISSVVNVTIEGKTDDGIMQYFIIRGLDDTGNTVWEYKTSEYPGAELDSTSMCLSGDYVYVLDVNKYIRLNKSSGEVVAESVYAAEDDSAFGATMYVDDEMNLYAIGFYSNTLYKIDKEANLLWKHEFSYDFYWPDEIKLKDGNVIVTFDCDCNPVNLSCNAITGE
ncbi:MAG: zinc-ribbon domain-containing protein [Butyrivibrio sp.]|nr:zinc-ribbon domain-containing protein [Butyrivibrio sp.]